MRATEIEGIIELPSTTFRREHVKKSLLFLNNSDDSCHSSEQPNKMWLLSSFSGIRKGRDHDITSDYVIV